MPRASSAGASSLNSERSPQVSPGSMSLSRNFDPSVTRNAFSISSLRSTSASPPGALAPRDAHLALEPPENADAVRTQHGTDLHRLRPLCEGTRDVVAGVDAAEGDDVERHAGLQQQLLEADELVAHDERTHAAGDQRRHRVTMGRGAPLGKPIQDRGRGGL